MDESPVIDILKDRHDVEVAQAESERSNRQCNARDAGPFGSVVVYDDDFAGGAATALVFGR